MNKLINIVIDELKDKNAGFDTIKMCLRIAEKASGMQFSESEFAEMFNAVSDGCPFDPMEAVY